MWGSGWAGWAHCARPAVAPRHRPPRARRREPHPRRVPSRCSPRALSCVTSRSLPSTTCPGMPAGRSTMTLITSMYRNVLHTLHTSGQCVVAEITGTLEQTCKTLCNRAQDHSARPLALFACRPNADGQNRLVVRCNST